MPSILTESRLNTPDDDAFAGDMVPGAPMDDAPMQEDGTEFWLLDRVGNRFMALVHVEDPAAVDANLAREFKSLAGEPIPLEVVLVSAKPGTYLIRPDQHVAARWRAFDAGRVKAALARATCNSH